MRIKLPSISYIVARSWPDSIIGRDNQLPWHLKTDLQRFKQITTGHAMIMGRKTYLSIGRPLPNRTSIVLSRSTDFDRPENFWHTQQTSVLWAENRESALFFADVITIAHERSEVFVIGGSEMYRIFGDLFNKIHLTEVLTGNAFGREPNDAIFEYKIDNRKWHTMHSELVPAGPNDDFPSRYTVMERRTKFVRYVEVEDYFTEIESKKMWVQHQLDLFDEVRLARSGKPVNIPYQYKMFEDLAKSA